MREYHISDPDRESLEGLEALDLESLELENESRALDLYERYEGTSVDALNTAGEMQSVKDAEAKLADANAEKVVQDNGHRATFLTFAKCLVAGCIAGNFGVFVAYMISQWGEVSEPVMLAWIGATIVEVVGIITVIAKYLFQSD